MKISNDFSQSTAESINKAGLVLQRGGIIAFPTETYYGLGVDPFNTTAVESLFRLKQRERHKPILVLVSDLDMLMQLVTTIPEQYQVLMKRYWPGPLTLIFPAKKEVSSLLTGESGTVGIRISSNPIVQQIFKKWPKPFTATSANISKQAPAKSSSDVLAYFGDKIDCLIDGGDAPAGLCSTIVGLRNNDLTEIRKGQIAFSKLRAFTNK